MTKSILFSYSNLEKSDILELLHHISQETLLLLPRKKKVISFCNLKKIYDSILKYIESFQTKDLHP